MPLSADQIKIRTICTDDDAALATVIRTTLKEFGANRPGTVYYDASTDHISTLFSDTLRSVYYVAELDGNIVGGGGIYPTEGLPPDTCELVKMYLLPHVRGIGLGRRMIDKCLEFAKQAGYKQVYLETMPELRNAVKTYERFGFEYLDKAMGNTGHFGCDLWMLKKL